MTFKKIPCSTCSGYRSCSRRTRAFVNYCGTNKEVFAEHIKIAIQDCLTRKGHLFKRTSLAEVSRLAA